jgi:hypothetical protein
MIAESPNAPVIFRWDLDKTYLLSEFESLREMMRIPFERAEDKVAAPGVAALIRGLRTTALGRGRGVRVYFLSASPPQIGRAIRRKLELDGILYDGIVFKDQLQRLFRGKFRHLREQVGYKLTELLKARRAEPAAAREYLFGDDWESDPLIYSLYADVVAGRVAPAALAELLGLLGWGGFGLRAHRTKTTPLLRMIENGARLDPAVTIGENVRDGLAPGFQEQGFLRPDRIPLIEAGGYRECLASPRSSREYGATTNGASESEMPESLELAAGDLAPNRVLERMGTGIWISNLWYLNYSDRAACRTTGMTRFATFWVERGRIAAPASVMRWDDTLYRMLGGELEALTDQPHWILDNRTYGGRSVNTSRVPGALLRRMAFTL